MTEKMAKADKIKYVARVNEEGARKASFCREMFDKPIPVASRALLAVVENLSKRYPSVAFTVKWFGGNCSVWAEPAFIPIPVPTATATVQFVDDCFKMAQKSEAQVDREIWPSFAELCAYARGFADAPDHTEELERLKKELLSLQESPRSRVGGFPPPPPPWWLTRSPIGLWY